MNNQNDYEIDPDHPWVEASQIMGPQPIPTVTKLDAVTMTIPQQEGPPKEVQAAILSVVTPAGVTTVILDPGGLNQLGMQAAVILQGWATAPPQGLVVADGNMEKEARNLFDLAEKMRNGNGSSK